MYKLYDFNITILHEDFKKNRKYNLYVLVYLLKWSSDVEFVDILMEFSLSNMGISKSNIS